LGLLTREEGIERVLGWRRYEILRREKNKRKIKSISLF